MASRLFHIELLRWVDVSGNPPGIRRILMWNGDILVDNQKERCHIRLPGNVIDQGVGVQAAYHHQPGQGACERQR